ncbi:MAG: MotA/TolQ/ExbB proton channel family protein [Candidatus Krumholzibacteriota bacterium]|nr:MotA/TolQ/ExbB proton channel family protein [Candidatus Krumholzibacteriota bacterium]
MWAIFAKGGVIMIPIVAMSILGVAVIIEKLITLRQNQVINREVVNVIEQIESPADIPMAIRTCERYRTPFANIMRVGLEEANEPLPMVRQAMEDTGRREVKRLERFLDLLETVAAVSPLLGLLGTVIGMIEVFSVISVQGVGQTGRLAGGIAQALITTAAGLGIGIPALVMYNLFDSRVAGFVVKIDTYAHVLLKRISLIRGRDLKEADFRNTQA